MHELSIAQSVVSTVRAAVGGRRVLAVTLRIGPLAGVVPEALTFGWDVVTSGTPLAGSRLDVERVPVEVRCAGCGTTAGRTTSPPWHCDGCGSVCAPVGDGRTLEVGSVEVEDVETDDAEDDAADLAVGA